MDLVLSSDNRLGNGSLVVMQGEPFQACYKWVTDLRPYTGVLEGMPSLLPVGYKLTTQHEIPKEPKIKTGRISLTFRQLV